ncbi:MAG: NUDIX hydrolase, partial [Acidovorax sp.]|nr:NUDIX hydrolase [Acidovorax sp.]
MTAPSKPAPAWVAAARRQAHCPPVAPRVPLLLGRECVGSVDAAVFDQIGIQRLLDKRWQLSQVEHQGQPAWALPAQEATAALNALAHALRTAGCCGPWRDEQLAVCTPDGRRLATV